MTRIAPRSGTAFTLDKGQELVVVDPDGEQVADLVCFSRDDPAEALSAGRTFDYQSKIYLGEGDRLWSNRSGVMLTIVADDVGRHDFLLAPCSREMFAILYDNAEPHRGCFGNLAAALAAYGIAPDSIPTAFNCFMNVPVDGSTGRLSVEAPLSKPGDAIRFRAGMDLIVGLTACSAPQSNNGAFKPIDYRIE